MILDTQLGVDLGTAYSKLVLRLYGARGGDRAYVLAPDGEPLIPSLVVWDETNIYFGGDAVQRAGGSRANVLVSPKVAFAYPHSYQWQNLKLPAGFSISDVMVLLLAYLLQQGHDHATRLKTKARASTVRMGVTVGVPTAQLEKAHLRDEYLAVVRTAFELHRQFRDGQVPSLAGGNPIAKTLDWVLHARAAAMSRPRGAVSDWLRSEASAGLLAAYHSPRTEPGHAYLDLDVGAGTCSASSFFIENRHENGQWTKGGIGYYGSWCEPPGADFLTARVSNHQGYEGFLARGDEAAEQHLGWSGQGQQVTGPVHDFARQVFGGLRHAYSEMNKRLKGYDVSRTGLFLFGGGARPAQLRELWGRGLWPQQPPTVLELAVPTDLRTFHDSHVPEHIADRFLVAYGLSHLSDEVPLAIGPGDFHVVDPDIGKRMQQTLADMYEK
jgi:hypothetical protein